MKLKSMFLALLVLLSANTSAEIVTITKAYEIALSEFRVPAVPSGTISFRECPDCEPITVRITPNTRFVVNDRSVGLKEFRSSIFQVRDRARETVIVMHHLESDTVTELSVSI